MPLYHPSVYMPKLRFPTKIFQLRYTNHATRAATNDRYGYVNLPSELNPLECKIVEVETDRHNNIVKVVYRKQLNQKLDLCLVIMVQESLVKTIWLNEANDAHRTLDRSKYATR